MELIGWLVQGAPISNRSINDGFYRACRCNHLIIAQWLFNRFKISDTTLHDAAIASDSIDMLKWLHGTNRCSVVVWTEIFHQACKNGKVDIADWLLWIAIGPTEIDYIFINCDAECIARLLVAKFPWCYAIENYNERIVFSSAERNWRRRRDAILAWKQGKLARLPDDMAREIVEWI